MLKTEKVKEVFGIRIPSTMVEVKVVEKAEAKAEAKVKASVVVKEKAKAVNQPLC